MNLIKNWLIIDHKNKTLIDHKSIKAMKIKAKKANLKKDKMNFQLLLYLPLLTNHKDFKSNFYALIFLQNFSTLSDSICDNFKISQKNINKNFLI